MINTNFSEKVVFVTGGGSDLGIAMGKVFGQMGAKVILCDVRKEVVQKAVDALTSENITAMAIEADVTKPEMIHTAFAEGESAFGLINVLVNSAGITKMQDIQNISTDDWDLVFNINVRGGFCCSQEFFSRLRAANQGGSIINIASNAAKVTFPGQVHYNASKAAVVNMTQSLAKELAPFGINVNAVCPGAIDTAMLRYCMDETIKNAPKGEEPTIEDLRACWGPPQLGRLIQPVEVANVVAFLATDAAAIIRGQSISVDAGNTPY